MDSSSSIYNPLVCEKIDVRSYILGYLCTKSVVQQQIDDGYSSLSPSIGTLSISSGEEESPAWKSLESEISAGLCGEDSATGGLPNIYTILPNYRPLRLRSGDSLPIDALDFVRDHESDDFKTNGIDMDLDEIDMKIYEERHNRTRETGNASTPDQLVPLEPCALPDKDKGKRGRKTTKNTVCVFCKKNGETLSVYGDHLLKDAAGRMTCPILRRYTCPICGSSGDSAHTIKYCPMNDNSPNSSMCLLKTPRNANGRKRLN